MSSDARRPASRMPEISASVLSCTDIRREGPSRATDPPPGGQRAWGDVSSGAKGRPEGEHPSAKHEDRPTERGGMCHQARSSSLMLVFERVFASTCLTITAQ